MCVFSRLGQVELCFNQHVNYKVQKHGIRRYNVLYRRNYYDTPSVSFILLALLFCSCITFFVSYPNIFITCLLQTAIVWLDLRRLKAHSFNAVDT